ncbi:MAG: hypothetical protein V2A53_10650 [bacterium]
MLVQQEVKDEIEKTCPRLRSGSGLVDNVMVGINPVRCLLSNGVKIRKDWSIQVSTFNPSTKKKSS